MERGRRQRDAAGPLSLFGERAIGIHTIIGSLGSHAQEGQSLCVQLSALACTIAVAQGTLAASAPRSDGFDRSHPLGLDYRQPYGILSTKYETPHVKWGKPLAGGPIRALVLAPMWSHRETVELAQRLDLQFTPWMCFGVDRPEPGATMVEQPFASRELVCRLLTEHLEKDYDVVIIGKLRWSMLPSENRSRLLEKIRGGTGLVYVCPPEINDELAPVFGQQSYLGHEEILRGVPWQALPCLRTADPARLVRTCDYGKGRVVVLEYQQPYRPPKRRLSDCELDIDHHCLTPSWVQSSRLADWQPGEKASFELGPYEYYQSLAARAVRWASGRSSPVKLAAKVPADPAAGKRISIPLVVEGPNSVASVSVAVRTEDGREVFRAKLARGTSASNGSLRTEVPSLCAGRYFLDLWARDAAAHVLEWATYAFEVHHDNWIEKVELVNRVLGAGDVVRAKVQMAKPLSADHRLRAELWDLNGRCIDVREFAPVGQFAEVTLGPLAPVHIMHELRIIISEPDKGSRRLADTTTGKSAGSVPQSAIRNSQFLRRDLVDHRYQFPVRARLTRDDFSSVVWVNEGSRNSLPTLRMLQKLHEDDEADAALSVIGLLGRRPRELEEAESEMAARQCAMANLMVIPNGGFGVGWNEGVEAVKGTHATALPLIAPERLKSVGEQGRRDAEFFAPYGPFCWFYASETVYAHDPDLDWHPDALARFRRLLKEDLYASLEALNREWGTNYTSWDQVMPMEFAEAKRTGNYAPWVTHKLSSDAIFADYFKYAGGTIREIDGSARTGLDADSGLYGPNFGYDWWLLSKSTQMAQSYTSHTVHEMQSEVKRSFFPADPSTVSGLWYGPYGLENRLRPSTIEYCQTHAWYSLFHHMNSEWWWTMGSPGPVSGYAPDLTSLACFEARTQALREIKAGIGKLVLSSTRADDGIAIHFSESSRIADALYSEKSDYWKCDYEDALGNLVRPLEDAGFQYRFVAYEEIENGTLQERGYRVLFLPHSRAVSDREAAQILEFARKGGVVIADILPATLTKTGGKRPASALQQLFPEDKPGTVTRVGQGSAILVGTDLFKGYYRGHNGSAGWQALGARWRKIADLLKVHAGLEPAVAIEPVEGDMPPIEVARFNANGIELVGLIRSTYLKDDGAYWARIRLPRRAHLYDVRARAYLGYTDYCDKSLDYQAELLALSPYKVRGVDVELFGKPAPGKPLKLRLGVVADSERVTGRHILRVTVLGPDGKERKWYAQNVMAPEGRATMTIPLALNETAGSYTILAKDVMSGMAGQMKFTLTAGGRPGRESGAGQSVQPAHPIM